MKEDVTGETIKHKAEMAAAPLGVDISTMPADLGVSLYKSTESISKTEKKSYEEVCQLYGSDPEYSFVGKWNVLSYYMEKDAKHVVKYVNDFLSDLTPEEDAVRLKNKLTYEEIFSIWEKGYRKKMKKLNKEKRMGLSRRDIDEMVRECLEGSS